MIKMPPNMAMSDYSQWLNDGYFFFSTTGSEDQLEIGQIMSYPNNHESEFWVIDIDGNEKCIQGPIIEKVFPHWPMCGATNIPDYKFAVVARRLQRQQYRRTYNSRCVDIKIPRKWEYQKLRSFGFQVNGTWPYLVKELFNPKYYTVAQLPKMWEEGWFSVAVNPHIIVVNIPPEKPMVYYRNELVGYLNNLAFEPTNPKAARRVAKHLNGQVIV